MTSNLMLVAASDSCLVINTSIISLRFIPGNVRHAQSWGESLGGRWAHGCHCPEHVLSSSPACEFGRAAARAATVAGSAL